MVVTLIGILATIAVPMYQNSVIKAREAALAEDLFTLRDAIDKYYADNRGYPASLSVLAEKKYIRFVPEDPFTRSSGTWVEVPSDDGSGLYDIKSGSDLVGTNGVAYQEW